MSVASEANRLTKIYLGVVALVWITGRYLGDEIFTHPWSFEHFSYVAPWYKVVWPLLAGLAGYTIATQAKHASRALEDHRGQFGLASLFSLLFLAFGYGGPLYVGGNLWVGELTQFRYQPLDWYELWSHGLARLVFDAVGLIGWIESKAAVGAWRTTGGFATILAVIAAVRIAVRWPTVVKDRFAVLLLVLGPPTALLTFSFIGPASWIPAFGLWFVTFAIDCEKTRSRVPPLLLTVITGLAPLAHPALLILIPAWFYIVVTTRLLPRLPKIVPLVLSLVGLGLGTAYLYSQRATDFRLQELILSTAGTAPFKSYGLWSSEHLGDILQLVWLVAPLTALIIWELVRQLPRVLATPTLGAALIVWLGGATLAIILNPRHSIVLDLPLLGGLLFGGSVLLAGLVQSEEGSGKRRLATLAAIGVVALPLAWMPILLPLDRAEVTASSYFDTRPLHWQDGVIALRDAWLVEGNTEQSADWDNRHIILSPDELTLRGSFDLMFDGQYAAAVVELHRLVARRPFWEDARAQLAVALMNQQRWSEARPHLDTLLILSPHRKEFLMNDYSWSLGIGRLLDAREKLNRAIALLPEDLDLSVDLMNYYALAGHVDSAAVSAEEIIRIDSSRTRPYVVLGRVAEQRADREAAIQWYQRYLGIASRMDPDYGDVIQRLSALRGLPPR